jgi:predicted dehydrogenase
MAINSKLRIGVVGLGKMGIMHTCLLNTFPNVEIAALCDKSRMIRTITKQPFKDAVVTDDLSKLAGMNLDAVFVLTPIPSHYFIIKQIYNEKITKNVFVEKTLTSAFSRSEELVALSKLTGGVNMVGYMKRFGVTFNKVRSLLSQNVLGDLIGFDAYAFSSDFADVPDGSTLSMARGGVIEDLGSHVVDLAIWLFGDLRATSGKANSRIAPDSEDDISFRVNGPKGILGNFEVSWRKKDYRMPEFGITIHGTRGSLSANDDEVKLELNGAIVKRWYRPDMNDNVGYLLGGPEYYREDKHFLDSLTNGTQTNSDFEGTLKVDFLLDHARRLCSK